MEDSPGSDRPLKRIKYEQPEDHYIPILTLPGNMALGITRPVNNVPGPLTDAPLFGTPWPLQSGLQSGLASPPLSEDLPPWVTALSGEETFRQPSIDHPHPYHHFHHPYHPFSFVSIVSLSSL